MKEHKINKIPPPVLTLGLAIVMWGLKKWVPFLTFTTAPYYWIAPLVGGLGVMIIVVAFNTFRRHGTTIDPVNPNRASKLVTQGIFSHSRNPMYVGFALILLGWNFWLGAVSSLAGIIFFVIYISTFQIPREEVVLKEKFGESYVQYQKRVRKWV